MVLHLVKARMVTSPEVLCEKLADGFSRLYRARNLIVALQPGDEPSGPEFQQIAKSTVLPSGFMNLLREGQIIAREQRPAAVILYTIGFNQVVFVTSLFAANIGPIIVVPPITGQRSLIARIKSKLYLRWLAFLRVTFVATNRHSASAANVQPLRVIECDPYTDSADTLAYQFGDLFTTLARSAK